MADLKHTPLDALHRGCGARMVPFAGYAMPVQFEGIIAEHLHTRSAAGLFDVSHMGQAILRGNDPKSAIESLVPGAIADLGVDRMRYTLLTDDSGGIIDDLMVTNRSDHLFLVVNASRKDVDLAHIAERLSGKCEVERLDDRALLALQGPKAAEALGRLAPACRDMAFLSAADLDIAGAACTVTRSGYTGEDGFEISVPSSAAEALASALLDLPEVKPVGLGARDSLRLEAGLCLYGNDIDETTTPIEAGLAWTIQKRRRTEGGFPGAKIILKQLAEGPKRRRVGIIPEGKAPARAHTPIADSDGNPIGEVTSGGYGPSVGGPLAMGYVDAAFAAEGTRLVLTVRGRDLPAHIAKMPFVQHRYFKI